ncbi:MAG: hypothetical protein KME17_00120 [Cyanosarcina radialis HA8281-LM2]|nr:hypothetical protein [Cyanosarcina radialis HA8281-LM2]
MKRPRIVDRQLSSNKWLILGGLAIFSLQGCGGNLQNKGSNTFPEEFVRGFNKGCTESSTAKLGQAGAEKFCSCSIAEFQKKYNYDEFKKVAQEAQNNKPAPEYVSILTECAKQAGAGS